VQTGRAAARDMILVFGLPRSGTSWLGKIFDSHPQTLYRHEPDKHIRVDSVPVVFPADRLDERRASLEAFLDMVLANRTAGVAGKLPFFPKSYRSAARHWVWTALACTAKALPRNLSLRGQVPDLIGPGRPKPRLVWKSITSTGRLGALARLLPEAKVVLILRHPCGQIASILRGHAAGQFHGPPPSEQYRVLQMLVDTAQGRSYGLTLDALRAVHPVERMAWRWVLFLDMAVAGTAGVGNCRLLRYEDLCAAPVDGTRELFEFTGLGWHPQTERFLRESTEGENAQYFGLRKDPLRSANKWQSELAHADVQRILGVIARSPVGRLYLDERAEPAPSLLGNVVPGPWRRSAAGTVLAEGFSLSS
jgi:hypothetical protein